MHNEMYFIVRVVGDNNVFSPIIMYNIHYIDYVPVVYIFHITNLFYTILCREVITCEIYDLQKPK